MSTAAVVAVASPARVRRLDPAWPLYAFFVALPVWWMLGAAYFFWPILAFPLLVSLLLRDQVRLAPRFVLWLLFLAWIPLSALQLGRLLAAGLFVYRASLYLSATVLFLYILNTSRRDLPDAAILKLLGLFTAEVIVGGFLGVLFPHASFHTPVESIVPQSFLADQTAYYFVHPAFAEVMTFLGYPVGRPKTFFAYSNQWGACVAVLLPLAFGAYAHLRSGPARRLLGVILAASIVPIIVSLNRGLWLSLGAGLVYAGLRLARRQNLRALSRGLTVLLVVGAVAVVSPLGTLVHDRFTAQKNSNDTRLSVYQETVDQVRASPLIGYGSPRSETIKKAPAVGTQGQGFTLLFSYGVPALVLFAGWFVSTFLRSRRSRSQAVFWANVSLLVLLVELPYYNYMPTTLHVGMVAAAIVWRDAIGAR